MAVQRIPRLRTLLPTAWNVPRRWPNMGSFKAAEKLYLQLLQVNPKSYEVHNDLGVLYLTEQRYDVACPQFLLATNFNPKASVGYQNLGIC